MSANSTRKLPPAQKPNRLSKPPKVHKDFPLWPHKSGRWCKKVKQRFHYFGRWDDPDADPADAERLWDSQKKYLRKGESPPVTLAVEPEEEPTGETKYKPAKETKPKDRTVKLLFNEFLTCKEEEVESGELRPRTFADYESVCKEMLGILGASVLVESLVPEDFHRLKAKVKKTRSVTGLASFINKARVVFSWGLKDGKLRRPVRYGKRFSKPKPREMENHENSMPEKFFEADEIRTLIDNASQPLKAMILLGINAAMGNGDLGRLPLGAVNLDAGIVEFPRPKTGVYRLCPLWPETIAALREWLEVRPTAKQREDGGLLFLTCRGASWFSERGDNPISGEFAKLCRSLGLDKKYRGFYSLRHTHRTVADNVRDNGAASIIMGHKLPGMAKVYVKRNRIAFQRLEAITDHVRAWLFPDANQQDGESA